MMRNLLFKIGQIVKWIIQEIFFQVRKQSYELFGSGSRVSTKNGFIDYYDKGVKRYYALIDGHVENHRIDGPAKEYIDGRTEYYINGNRINELDNKHIYGKENLAKYLTLV